VRLDVDSKADVKKACVLHPFSELRFFWDVFVLFWIAYSAFAVPLQAVSLLPSTEEGASSLYVPSL
jgi:hypothetical protein